MVLTMLSNAISEEQDNDGGLSHLLRLEKRRSVCGMPCLARAHATRERLTRAPILIAPLPGPCGWWQWSGSLRRLGALLTPSHAQADRSM